MKKSQLNFIIDVIMFLLMGLLAGVGLLIKYVLLSGEDRWLKYEKNVDITFLNLDRHEWGTIHLIVAILLIAFLFLHIILHWKMIVGLCKNLFSHKGVRVSIVFLFTLLTILFVIFPFLIKINIDDLAPGRERFASESEHINTEQVYIETEQEKPAEIITGKTTEKLVAVQVEEKHEAEHHHVYPSI